MDERELAVNFLRQHMERGGGPFTSGLFAIQNKQRISKCEIANWMQKSNLNLT